MVNTINAVPKSHRAVEPETAQASFVQQYDMNKPQQAVRRYSIAIREHTMRQMESFKGPEQPEGTKPVSTFSTESSFE